MENEKIHEAMVGLAAQHPSLLLPGGPPAGSFARTIWDELSDEEKGALAGIDPAGVEAVNTAIAAAFKYIYPAGI